MAEDKAPAKAKGPTEDEAREAELARQQTVVDAVDEYNAKDAPKLGGPILEPGLGR